MLLVIKKHRIEYERVYHLNNILVSNETMFIYVNVEWLDYSIQINQPIN